MFTVEDEVYDKVCAFEIDILGVFATFFKKYNIINFVDQLIPKNKDNNVTHGECLVCLMLTHFCFLNTFFYSIDHSLKQLPIPILFGRNINYDDFSEEVLGKFLETIHEYGISLFFTQIANYIRIQEPNLMNVASLYADTENFSVIGLNEDICIDEPCVIYRTSAKNASHDDKLFSLFLLSNSNRIPVFMNTVPENCGKDTLTNVKEGIEALKGSVKSGSGIHFIADPSFSALKNRKAGFSWISRVPDTNAKAARLIDSQVELIPMEGDDGYSYFPAKFSYGGIPQSWLLVQSAGMAKKREKPFGRKLEKEMAAAKAGLSKLTGRSFEGEEEARKYANDWIAQFKYVKFSKLLSVSEEQKGTGIRPNKDETRPLTHYLYAELAFDEEAIEKGRAILGRFILATNDAGLKPTDILTYYKERSLAETTPAHFKWEDFQVSRVLIKNHPRAQGLACVMSVSLLVRSILEQKLRLGLKHIDGALFNMPKKSQKYPTLLYAAREFDGLFLFIFHDNDYKKIKIMIISLDDDAKNIILKALGPDYELFHYNPEFVLSHEQREEIIKFLSNDTLSI
ncbi:MAG: IS1634 family transposase [Deltaproteobacteria bacterium]|jgi:transposase|nr:IS1634 family transposase [Deltaproteobacteria bacterium]